MGCERLSPAADPTADSTHAHTHTEPTAEFPSLWSVEFLNDATFAAVSRVVVLRGSQCSLSFTVILMKTRVLRALCQIAFWAPTAVWKDHSTFIFTQLQGLLVTISWRLIYFCYFLFDGAPCRSHLRQNISVWWQTAVLYNMELGGVYVVALRSDVMKFCQ